MLADVYTEYIDVMKINERFIWAAEILDLDPADQLLEIGCGAGILVEQIASKLYNGSITAIDRSESMIKMASKRNAESIKDGKAKFQTGEFAKAVFNKSAFDKILAFNVNFFLKSPAKELEIIRHSVKPNGQLYVFYQSPFEVTIKAAEPIKNKLLTYSFEVTETFFKKMAPYSAFGILSKPV
jgi:ubiquinone/menaquinone biosynthesis C-methylase UbiE